MSYNIDAIRKAASRLSNEKPKSNNKNNQAQKLQFWKPTMGMNVVRFLPYDDGSGQPFQEIGYYNSKKLSDRRVIAPIQFGMPDPVADLLESLRPERAKKEVWLVMKELQMKPAFYAPVIVRGQEEKGVQIWEMSPTIVKSIYAVLTHPDWVDENLFDVENGYDLTVTVSDSGKTFNEYAVKHYEVAPRRKPEPLAKRKEDREKLVASVPNLAEHYKQFVKNEEGLKDLISNFLALFDDTTHVQSEDGLEVNAEPAETSNKTKDNVKSKIDAAFDFDDE